MNALAAVVESRPIFAVIDQRAIAVELAVTRIVVATVAEQGPRGPQGEQGQGTDNYTGDPLVFYNLAKS